MKLTIWLNNLVAGVLLITTTAEVSGQTISSLTLQEAQEKARLNYPFIKQQNLIKETESVSIANLNKGYLPQISITSQASYQSEVTMLNISMPGINVHPLDKDQYKITADINQLVFDGGVTAQQKKIQRLNTNVEEQKVEVELYKLRERINQLYLSILYLEEQLKQVDLIKKDLQAGIAKTSAQVKNGVAFRSNLDLLKAEFLKADQRTMELSSSKEGLLKTLGLFLDANIDSNTRLQLPASNTLENSISRPELGLYARQDSLLNQQKGLILAKNLPKLSVFGQGGYGRPGLNFLNNDFEWYYIAGARFTWNLDGLYTSKNEKKQVDLNKQAVDIQKETFLLNTNSQLTQQAAEIKKLNQLIASDKEIIALRERVKNAANAQLENGVITANDYLREVNAEDQAKQTLIAHQIQLIQAEINYQYLTGN